MLVFPSRTDTFGLVMIEALACGAPVAALPRRGRWTCWTTASGRSTPTSTSPSPRADPRPRHLHGLCRPLHLGEQRGPVPRQPCAPARAGKPRGLAVRRRETQAGYPRLAGFTVPRLRLLSALAAR
ncbi:hypothetical protein MOP88_11695 [Sphingomonas sp. WKB10]|nr:hypothetical protein [Sphingomonas sp. WKB10]